MNIAGWEQMYRSGERGMESEPTTLLVETAEGLVPGTSIDLACGTGRNALYLASKGWTVTALDGSESAIATLRRRAAESGREVTAVAVDLCSDSFTMQPDTYDLVVVAFYLQRDLFPKIREAVRPGGLALAIVHLPEPGEEWSRKRAAPGELRELFSGWEILREYEGPSRDPAHRRPVAEIVARRPSHRTFKHD